MQTREERLTSGPGPDGAARSRVARADGIGPAGGLVAAVIALQQAAGNRAVVGRIVQGGGAAGQGGPVLQRQAEAEAGAAAPATGNVASEGAGPAGGANPSIRAQWTATFDGYVLQLLGRAILAMGDQPVRSYAGYRDTLDAFLHLQVLLDATPESDPNRPALLDVAAKVQAVGIRLMRRYENKKEIETPDRELAKELRWARWWAARLRDQLAGPGGATQAESGGEASQGAAPGGGANPSIGPQWTATWDNFVVYPLGRAILAMGDDPVRAYAAWRDTLDVALHVQTILFATPDSDPNRPMLLDVAKRVTTTTELLERRKEQPIDVPDRQLADQLRQDRWWAVRLRDRLTVAGGATTTPAGSGALQGAAPSGDAGPTTGA